MRKTFNLCISSHDEVMFRCREDYIKGFNCFAEAILETESRALADGEMSTHAHFTVQCDNHKDVIFQKQLGKNPNYDLLADSSKSKYLSRNSVARGYKMDKSGLLLREDIIDTSYVEELYISPRSFLLQMNRPSDEKWIKEQEEDGTQAPPVTLESIEPGVTNNIRRMLDNERGRVDYGYYSDIELCELIDNEYVPKYIKGCRPFSIYALSERERREIGIRTIFAMCHRNP